MYVGWANCAARVQQSLSDVVLSDMTQAPSILSSMVTSIQTDLQPVSAAISEATQLSQRNEASHRAILMLQKIHRAMCLRSETVSDAGPAKNADKPAPFEHRFL